MTMNKKRNIVIEAVSDVLSAPARFKEWRKRKKAENLVDAIKERRKYEGAPDYDDSGQITDAFKVRSVVGGMVDEHMKKVKKASEKK